MVIGLTGGIGSGKTTVAKYFNATFGVPIYIADDEAKQLMTSSSKIRKGLITLFGSDAYKDGSLNKPFLSKKIFNDKALLKKMNAIVHPEVSLHFKNWQSKQSYPYVIKESAILFENNLHTSCYAVITVSAPENIRIDRVKERDNKTEAEVKSVLNNQWTDDQREAQANYTITNVTLTETYRQIKDIHYKLLKAF